ncbi:flagellar motor protein PomA [Reinekea marina]|uniref:Flagellar motor protein PomA n=1 Tax=Reinekea marina TaxID=1310421 RepID=A0ABV7WPK6_9GAMM|nr:flagellar motor protein PomA [Reinekea marina]MBU2863511.1 flagellar motor protein PomA [Reinekea forsetii]MDN3650601.1 flagellar motor protein PomA [Reinekea marina]
MDIAMIVGLIGALAMIIMSMLLGGSLGIFINIPSVLIVFGGSTFVAMSKFTLEQFLGVGKVVGKAFSFSIVKPEDLIGEIVELADGARKGGLLSLEGKETSSDFLSKGIQLLVDGHDPEVVKTLLNKDMKMTSDRHADGAKFFSAMADVGPAMGMIGTLIGLVAMLANMDDPKTIGPAMAVALLTTLYGSFLATVICIPIADKLGVRSKQEETIQKMAIDGLLAIQAGQNPRIIESMLKSYLPSNLRGE